MAARKALNTMTAVMLENIVPISQIGTNKRCRFFLSQSGNRHKQNVASVNQIPIEQKIPKMAGLCNTPAVTPEINSPHVWLCLAKLKPVWLGLTQENTATSVRQNTTSCKMTACLNNAMFPLVNNARQEAKRSG